tara:strand:+ start:622 stop:1149 length:528 start_codon:yes stop_codon:yes gene_type:complete
MPNRDKYEGGTGNPVHDAYTKGITYGSNSGSSAYDSSAPAVTVNSLGISSDDSEYASKTRAAISRDQWEDYKARFQPYEDRLAAIYKNGGLLEGEAEKIPETVNQSFSTMRGIADRNLSRYGITPTADQAASRDRSSSLDQVLAQVDAQNNLMATADQRKDKIMTGGIDTMNKGG